MWRLWLATLFWGFNWPAVKTILTAVQPWSLRAAGLTAGGALLALATIARGHSLALPRTMWRHVAVAGTLNIAAFNICAVFAQLSMPTSRAAILTFTMPLWAALIGWLAYGEKLDRVRVLSLCVGVAGLAVLMVPFFAVVEAGGVPYGLAYVLGAAISWALGTVYLKRHPIAVEPLVSTTWQVLFGAGVCTIGMFAFETPALDLTAPLVMAAFVYHVVLAQALAYALWFSLLRTVPAVTASIGTLLIPIFAVTGAVLILGDQPTALDFLGLALILTAVGIDQLGLARR